MLPDPIVINTLLIGANVQTDTTSSWSLVNLDGGKSTRVCTELDNNMDANSFTGGSLKATMTISSATSQENKPIVTDRTMVRIDFTRKVPADPLVNPTGSVYVVLAQPRAEIKVDDMVGAFKILVAALLRVSGNNTTLSTTSLERVLSGEG